MSNSRIISNPSYFPALNMGIVYRNSLKKILKSPLPYVILGVTILADAFAYFLWPYVTNMGNISIYYESDTWVVLTMQISFSIFALIGATIGETNAISNEKIYILSKPIKRGTFLCGKCLSTLTVAFLFAMPTILILTGIAVYELLAHQQNIFDITQADNPYAIFGSFIAILIFSSFISTIWKYQTRGGIWIITCFGILLTYVVLYPMLANVWESDFTVIARFWWLFLPIPICILLTCFGTALGSYIFIKSEIES